MKIIECDQYTTEWWDARRGLPTASNASRIITPAKGDYSRSAAEYICELIADLYDPEYAQHEPYQTAAMKNGHLMEPEARRMLAFERGYDVRQVGFCVTDDGRAGCSPDALALGDDGEPVGCVEIKCPEPKTHVRYLMNGGLPSEYKPQCHWHLAVTGLPWCDFLCYARGLPPLLIRVEPDGFTAQLREHMARFVAELDEAKKHIARVAGPAAAGTVAVSAPVEPEMMTDLDGSVVEAPVF